MTDKRKDASAEGYTDSLAEAVAERVIHALAGVPKGFLDKGSFLWVRWQQGPKGDPKSVEGAQVKDVIELALRRLGDLQTGKFVCEENRLAMRLLTMAKDALAARTKHRAAQAVEGKLEPHDTPADFLAVSKPLMDILLRTSLTGLALPKP